VDGQEWNARAEGINPNSEGRGPKEGRIPKQKLPFFRFDVTAKYAKYPK
jgi:hypothetical protein